MEREEYLKPEITSDIIEIGVYGFYYEDGDPVSHKKDKLKHKKGK